MYRVIKNCLRKVCKKRFQIKQKKESDEIVCDYKRKYLAMTVLPDIPVDLVEDEVGTRQNLGKHAQYYRPCLQR